MNIQDAVFQKVSEQLNVDKNKLTLETTFLDLGADSLDMVEFSLEVEDHFQASIGHEQIAQIKTLGQAIEFIEKNKKPN